MSEKPRTLKFGDVVLEVADPANIQPVSADLFTECRNYNSVVCLSFASIAVDGSGPPAARITARLRLTLPGAADLRNALDNILKDAMPGKEKAN
jgi:hypothetical protein